MGWRDWVRERLPRRPGPGEQIARDRAAEVGRWDDMARRRSHPSLSLAQTERLSINVWEARDRDRAASGADRWLHDRAAGMSNSELRAEQERHRSASPLRPHGSLVRLMDRAQAANRELASREQTGRA